MTGAHAGAAMTTPEATPGSPPAAAPYDAGAKQKREAKTSRIPIKVVAADRLLSNNC